MYYFLRLTLAAMSPLLARAMNNDAEEPDYIHVDGATLSALQEMVNILYKGTYLATHNLYLQSK